MKFSYHKRILALSAAVVGFALVLILRLFFVQIINGSNYIAQADRQYVKHSTDIFSRGTIFFQERGGATISAAGLKTQYIVSINPNILSDALAVFEKINGILPIDKLNFLEKSSKKDDPYEMITRTEDQDVFKKINGLRISGVNLYKENARSYPGGRLAANILGLVAQDSNEGDRYAGRYGLERYYDDILRRDDSSLYVNFFVEMFSNAKKAVVGDSDKFLNSDIVLSIEPNVETYLEKELSGLKNEWNPDSIGAIIMDPKTGRIIGASVLPNFDPNNFSKELDSAVFSLPLVENVFELGSIVKPLTMSAGIDAGVITPQTKYDDKGFVLLNGKKIENHDKKRMGTVDMQAVIDNSLNTGAVFVMQRLGREQFRNYMESFGIGEKTDVDLPSETFGLINNLNSKYEIDYATAAFGQGIALTPIGAARALSVLANGGLLVKPHLVDRIESPVGLVKVISQEVQRRVIKSKTAEQITGMLVHAFDFGLLGGKYKISQYSIAAKTGTAQIPDAHGGYSDKTLHSFFGYFPAYDARFLVLIYMVDPKNGARFSSDTLSAPFADLAKFLLNYYEVAPDR